MPVTAAGPIADAIAGLTALLANSPYFQNWTGTANAAAAAARIFAQEAGYPIVSIAASGAALTVQTRDDHGLSVDQVVTLAGSAIGPQSALDVVGQYTVASTPTDDTFTVASAAAATSQTFADFAFVYPGALPLAFIFSPDDGALQSERNATGAGMIQSGKLEIMFEANTSGGYVNDPVNAPLEANTVVGKLVQSMQATNDTGVATWTDGDGNDLEFVANSIQLSVAPRFVTREEQDNSAIRFERWRALIEVTWGLTG